MSEIKFSPWSLDIIKYQSRMRNEACKNAKVEEAMHNTTSSEDDRRQRLMKKLQTQSVQAFRDTDIDEYDLNITDHFAELEEIDETVSPLVYCAYFGLKEICRLFLTNKNVDIDLETPNNRQTPLITACMRGNYEMVRLLLLWKAETNKPNALGHVPLAVAIFRLVEDASSFQNKTICMRICELLVRNGANVNWIIDKQHGYSLLHYFCSLKLKMTKQQKQVNIDIVRFLLSHGANIMQKTLEDKNCYDLLEHSNIKEQLLSLLKEVDERK